MFRAVEGVFNHISSSAGNRRARSTFISDIMSFPCFANALISISAGGDGDQRGGREALS